MYSQLDLSTTIKFYPDIVDGHKAGALWALCRGLDKNGSGKFSFTMQELSTLLDVGERTIFKYMGTNLFFKKEDICNKPGKDYSHYNWCQDKFVYHTNKIGEKVYTIYYKSLHAVLAILDIHKEKLCCEKVALSAITKKNKKIVATEIVTITAQKSAQFAAKRDKSNKHKKILKPEQIFDNSSVNCDNNLQKAKGVKSISDSVVLVNTDYAGVGVVSQNYIAKQMGRCKSTINRRLSKSKLKRKTLYLTSEQLHEDNINYFRMFKKSSYFVNDLGEVICLIAGKICKKHCSIYENVRDVFTKFLEPKDKVERKSTYIFNTFEELEKFVLACKQNMNLYQPKFKYNFEDLWEIYTSELIGYVSHHVFHPVII